MAAVVDAFFVPGALQIVVCHIRPCSPPQNKLLVVVPAFRDGILPAIFGAFRIFGHLFIALCLFELSGGKAPFFAVFDAEIVVINYSCNIGG